MSGKSLSPNNLSNNKTNVWEVLVSSGYIISSVFPSETLLPLYSLSLLPPLYFFVPKRVCANEYWHQVC